MSKVVLKAKKEAEYCIKCGSNNLEYNAEKDKYICKNCRYVFRLIQKYLNPKNTFFKHCPLCGSNKIVKNENEVMCDGCGMIFYHKELDEQLERFIKGLPLEKQISIVEIDERKVRIDFDENPIMLIEKDDKRLSLEVFSDMFVKIRLKKGVMPDVPNIFG